MSTPDPPTVSEPLPAKLPYQRLASIDAYRGLVMFLMLAEVLRFRKVAEAFAGSEDFWGNFWRFLAYQQSHVDWTGCALHDLIQPSFSFLVGVALPFSIASRIAKGQSPFRMTAHAFGRALILILLGVFLRSINHSQTYWTFEDTLTQIGLGYVFLFLLGFRSVKVQVAALVLVLVGYWAAFALYPLPGENFDWVAAGVSPDWQHNASGFAAHWNKNTNPARAFDLWFLNLFPRESEFVRNNGGYSTLSFIPTLGVMILGLLAGGVLRSQRKERAKIGGLVLLGALCLGLGWAAGYFGICPVVKKIWTPSWALFSGGWCFLILAGMHLFFDLTRLRILAFPLIVIGANSIVAYCLAGLKINPFFGTSLVVHFGADSFKVFGEAYEPVFLGACVLLIDWLILFWMYRNKIFVRI